jgi:DNA ligase-associated metallophosphoesterase
LAENRGIGCCTPGLARGGRDARPLEWEHRILLPFDGARNAPSLQRITRLARLPPPFVLPSLAPPSPPTGPLEQADRVLVTRVAGERVALLAERALAWPREHALFVADVHLGKAAAFRAGGVPLPRGSTAADLARLTRLIEVSSARHLVILGDFLHARAGRVPALDAAFVAWRQRHAALKVTLVRGNHDAHAGDPPAHWNVACVDDALALPPFLGCHHPVAPPTGYALCGHLHPGVTLATGAGPAARLPCFVLGARRAILPAFGRFTGLAPAPREPGDRQVAIAGSRLFTLP